VRFDTTTLVPLTASLGYTAVASVTPQLWSLQRSV